MSKEMVLTKKSKKMFSDKLISFSEKIEQKLIVRVIRNGLVTMIPLLMIGGIALILQTLPIIPYQEFISSFAGGFLFSVFHAAYMVTFGFMSVYMAISFSISYFNIKEPEKRIDYWGVLTALCSFLIMDGIAFDSFSVNSLGASSVALAMATSIIASFLYRKIHIFMENNRQGFMYGMDSRMNSAMTALIPAALVIALASIICFLVTLTGKSTIHELLVDAIANLFGSSSSMFGNGLIFVIVSGLLWCFGIHGGNCLQGVSDKLFVPLLNDNIAATFVGNEPTNILCKQFFDCFILMGGCGSAICLLFAVFIASKDKAMKEIARTAAFPMIFNINELMVFGLPIVFNPIMFIPFILVPVIQYLIAYAAMYFGLVPLVTSAVEWTTPIILGGYTATGSFAGSVLQLVNVFVGVLVYIPFVRMMSTIRANREVSNFETYISWYKANEYELQQARLCDLDGVYGDISKRLTVDLKSAIEHRKFKVLYQPQYNYDGKCIGVEALLRLSLHYKTPIYPPLLIQLANECNKLEELEEGILVHVLNEKEKIFKKFGDDIKISVNVTGFTVSNDKYWSFLKKTYQENPFTNGKLCIEVTEQAAVDFNDKLEQRFRECHSLGIMFAIDDFSMGQTSIKYLQNGLFDFLKLDGSLVLGLRNNLNCREIIASIVTLADSLNIDIIAEFVESNELRITLHEIGCNNYQGYLYSPAIPLE